MNELRGAVQACRGCSLWEHATQAVFGEGPVPAPIMLVGEQPGDQEDKLGSPFVGPAGRVLDEALEEIGWNRDQVYLSNVVKHFKWTSTGKRRIHQRPRSVEINACFPWLREEITRVEPEVLLCLGATGAQALLGRTFKVSERRGDLVESDLAPHVLATVHPSSVLRSRDDEARRLAKKAFVNDLQTAASYARRP